MARRIERATAAQACRRTMSRPGSAGAAPRRPPTHCMETSPTPPGASASSIGRRTSCRRSRQPCNVGRARYASAGVLDGRNARLARTSEVRDIELGARLGGTGLFIADVERLMHTAEGAYLAGRERRPWRGKIALSRTNTAFPRSRPSAAAERASTTIRPRRERGRPLRPGPCPAPSSSEERP